MVTTDSEWGSEERRLREVEAKLARLEAAMRHRADQAIADGAPYPIDRADLVADEIAGALGATLSGGNAYLSEEGPNQGGEARDPRSTTPPVGPPGADYLVLDEPPNDRARPRHRTIEILIGLACSCFSFGGFFGALAWTTGLDPIRFGLGALACSVAIVSVFVGLSVAQEGAKDEEPQK